MNGNEFDYRHHGSPLLFEQPTPQDPNAMLALELETIAAQPPAELMPTYIQDMFEVADIPRSIRAGESLEWCNGCKVSVKYDFAKVLVSIDAEWFELAINHQTGQKQRMRISRYGDLLAYEDSVGVPENLTLQNLIATMLLEFSKATSQLMVKH